MIWINPCDLVSFYICVSCILNIDNPFFEETVGQIYPTEFKLNRPNSSDTEAPFSDLNLSITNSIVLLNLR